MFGDQLKFGDGAEVQLGCAHSRLTETLGALQVLCPDCNQWVVPERGRELVQTNSEESSHVG